MTWQNLDGSVTNTGSPFNFDTDVTNQGNAFFLPEIFSKNVQIAFRRMLVAEAICNTDYMGEIAQYGDTVNIIKEPDITAADYTRSLTLSATNLTDEELVLLIDQAAYFAFEVEDLETRFSHVNWQTVASDRAAYKLRDKMDNNVMTAIKAGAGSTMNIGADTVTTTTDLSSTSNAIDIVGGGSSTEVDPLDVMSRAARKLDDNDVPEDSRWFVAEPEWYEELAKTNSKLLSVDYNQGDGGLRNGLVASGKLRGFSMYKSTQLGQTGPAPSNATGNALYGHMSAVSCASALSKVESLRSTTRFHDIVRGMLVWGRKVLRDNAVGTVYYVID